MEDKEWEQIANKLLDSIDPATNAVRNEDEVQNNVTQPHETICSSSNQRPIENFSNNFGTEIKNLDPNYNLSIYRYLENVHEDPIVLEYCEKLIELKFAPCEPHGLELQHFAKRVQKFDISSECQKNCVFMLVSYFKCCEIKQKLKLAEIGKSTLFQATAIPEFLESQRLFTIAGYERFSSLRTCLCIQVQRAASFENQFVMELLLIRICHSLMKDIQGRKNVVDVASDYIKCYFMFLYLMVKFEYVNSTKPSDSVCVPANPDEEFNIPTYPSWRIEEKIPPLYFQTEESMKIFDSVKKSNLKTFDISEVIRKLSKSNQI